MGGYSHSLVCTPEELTAELATVTKKKTLVISDEVDWWWLDQHIHIDRAALQLGLSATAMIASASDYFVSIELDYLNLFKV